MEDARRYPWGDRWRDDCCNSEEAGIGATSPVGIFPAGRSPVGVDDMAGNVREWCQTKWRESIREPEDNEPDKGAPHVLRGGSWYQDKARVRCSFRYRGLPGDWFNGIGFRCAQ
jgi:formylglycine-generating enzyme required for sulfatase activity